MLLSLDAVQAAFTKKSYTVKTRPYELNVFGVRSSQGATNSFDDVIGALYFDYGRNPSLQWWAATTDPGLFYLEHPLNVDGTAILVPRQHTESHRIGLHKGQYRALVQNKPLPVYRDSNKDDVYDFLVPSIQTGVFGINIHHAGDHSTVVDKWSAGCQVFAEIEKFDVLMSLVDMHVGEGYGDVFTYTLFNEKDLVGG